MTYDELYKMIRLKINLVNRPSNSELKTIARNLLELEKIKTYVTDEDLEEIVTDSVSCTLIYSNESIDMTASINIANQIIAKLKTSGLY